jgi:hypothetical protein
VTVCLSSQERGIPWLEEEEKEREGGGGFGGERRELERVLVLSLCTRRCRYHRKGSRMLLLGLS